MSTPIQSLPSELLLAIFTINSEMVRREERTFSAYDDSELCVTRRTAQVCRFWRVLMLQNQHIWANCIDLDVLKLRNRFRKLIRKRIGDNALLSIRGYIDFADGWTRDPDPDSFFSFLTSTLNDGWSRVRSFDVALLQCHKLNDKFWAFLQRKNPVLETFIVEFMDGVPKGFTELDKSSPLFSGDAPSLRTFDWCTPTMQPSRCLWYPQLREVGCSLPTSKTMVEGMSNRMTSFWDNTKRFKAIKSLKLNHCIQDFTDLPAGQVDLQTLEYLELSCDEQHAMRLLDIILISPTICLNMSLKSDHLIQPDIEALGRRFNAITETYLTAWPNTTQMTIHSHSTQFQISFGPILPHSRHFRIKIEQFIPGPMALFLPLIPLSTTEKVTSLQLVVMGDATRDRWLNRQYTNLISQFPSVTHLEPSPEVLRVITSTLKHTTTFPNLRSLKILGESHPTHIFNTQAIANISAFLFARKEAGLAPIETLDLRFLLSKANMVDLSGQDGLRIIKNVSRRLVEYTHSSSSVVENSSR